MSVGLLARGRWQLRKQAHKHLTPEPGEELTADTVLFGMVMRDRLTARGTAGMLAVAVGVVGLAAAAACLVAPTSLGGGGVRGGMLRDGHRSREPAPRPASWWPSARRSLAGVLGSMLAGARAAAAGSRPARAARPTPGAADGAARMLLAAERHLPQRWLAGSRVPAVRTSFFSVGVAVGALLTLPALLVAWRTVAVRVRTTSPSSTS